MDHGFLGRYRGSKGRTAQKLGSTRTGRKQGPVLWLSLAHWLTGSLALHFAAGEGTNGSTAEAGGGVAMAERGSMAMAERHHGCERGSMAEGEDP